MSLGYGAPSTRNCRSNRRPKHNRRNPRGRLDPNSASHYRSPKAAPPVKILATPFALTETDEEDYTGKRAEGIFDAHAYRAGLKSLKEPHAFYQGFKWLGTVRTRPDRFLVDLEVYVEITGTRRTSHKLDRINGAMKVALENGRLVDIILFDRDDIEALHLEKADLWDLLDAKLVALAAQRAEWAMAA
jgi:hypothetical protein